ncbi:MULTISPECIES: hypothetical protein [Olivibacter]|uniref:DUF5009 domain-containing protein n=1 Tax=Olivibacter jilunii TaxID=985016 RepID=A0ABW6B8P9_9SPHI|nr:DUF5009 domain-containing protein [Olivibacter sp. UJ_SKK_5.1]MDX3912827.1 DUF5009 domain-containing protein [Pseudosphingobacterium sp.]
MNVKKVASERILSVDIMRGLTLLLMLFVNDLFEPGVPAWLLHTKVNVDGMELADWVFPGFLFIVGVSAPYAIRSRLNKGLIGWGHFVAALACLLLMDKSPLCLWIFCYIEYTVYLGYWFGPK